MISNHSEGTFGRLRYRLGGDRPSQTTRLTLSQTRIHGIRLESQQPKSGIPTAAPYPPKEVLLRVPPILCISCRDPISSYSKALRGLSVQSRVNTHLHVYYNFAGPPVETPNRYSIRAGRNLPDKEFRYLRTVIVTAAVHRGLSSLLRLR